MTGVVPEDVERYAAEHTTPEPHLLAALAAETRESTDGAGMMVGPLEGRFLQTLVHLAGARRVLEIGMFTGYSALSMAAALPPDGRIVTCDINPTTEAIARRHIEASPWADRIDIRMGPAIDTIAGLEGPFDLVFIDADKGSYRDYYEAVLPLLADRGLIVVDNVLWSGRVLDPGLRGPNAMAGLRGPNAVTAPDTDADTLAIAAFNDHVASDPRVVAVMLTIRDGVTLIRRADR